MTNEKPKDFDLEKAMKFATGNPSKGFSGNQSELELPKRFWDDIFERVELDSFLDIPHKMIGKD